MTSADERDDGADADRPGHDETTHVKAGEIHDALLVTLSDAIGSLEQAEALVHRYRDLGVMGRAIAGDWLSMLVRSSSTCTIKSSAGDLTLFYEEKHAMEFTLESLGMTQTEFANRVVETVVNRLLSKEVLGTDEDGEEGEDTYTLDSPLRERLDKMVLERIDTALAAIIEKHILPNAQQYIENVTLQATNEWGQAKGKSMTFIEYLTQRAECYMTEKVDYDGKSKSERQSSLWKGTQTRIAHMIHEYLHYSIGAAMEAALKNGLSTIVKGIEETAKLKLAEISKTLKVTAQVKG